ncbi:lanthionine biosynthesis protein [Bacillus anthracis]|uniref:lantibiotic dehydratase n=1 Tax=Bacillus tropicus TaxID=2026188 RepID=UPI000BED6BEA|nr:lantibiotic dehydratase [Bacillus tropicus]PEF47108.1 lanthionine biosynthesis protein [Bacillus cereus]PEU74981.1 lanthionine biosynthesis protein [Bacillus anthracis]PEZ80687.1 lanthionine biosynthesis protein [Bacillus anthracis]PFR83553.1 lanthionine biosynthesis protein [Bacillus cereus]PFW31276.1 lanthionine biosynthesis protein [Bacillus anthracis]
MKYEILKNPIVLYRGSDVTKDWYNEMMATSASLKDVLHVIKKNEDQLAIIKERLIVKIENEFALVKEMSLLNLKRDIHNIRIGRIEKYIKICKNAELKSMLGDFVDLLAQNAKLTEELAEEYTHVLKANREILQKSIDDEEVLKSIVFYNNEIYQKIKKYTSEEVEKHSKKLKKLDYFLLKMLVRSSMKTSPFSHLTKTGLVSNTEGIEFEKTSYSELNHAVILQAIHRYLRSNEQALQRIPVKVENFGSKEQGIYYVTQNDVEQSKKVLETSDKFVEYKLDKNLIQFLHENKQKVIGFEQFKQIARKITIYQGKELQLFRKLVELKLLRQCITIPNNRGVITSIIQFLEEYEVGKEIIPLLEELHAALHSFEKSSSFERINDWNEIKRILSLLQKEDKKIGSEIIYEDVIFKDVRKDTITPKIRKSFLEGLADFILLFDVNVRVQYEIAQLFYEKYGKSTEKLSNSNLLNEVFFREIHQFYPYYQNQKYRYKEAKAKEIQQLDELRDQFLKEFESLILNVDQSVEVIDIELLIEKYTSLIPEYIKKDSNISYTLFLQETTDENIVLNNVYDGQEKFISRFKDFFMPHYETKEYSNYIERVFNEDNCYEVDELFGFNGGIHKRKSHNIVNLDVGYQRFNHKDAKQVRDFTVRYNTEKKKIEFLDANDKICNLAYKSSLVPMFLPGILSVMLYLFQSGRLNFDITSLVKEENYVPRITFGNVVLSRKKWKVIMEDLKGILESKLQAHELYEELNRYFKQKQLPKQFFLKHYRQNGDFMVEKPIFFDIESPVIMKFFIHEIQNAIENSGSLYIEEVLPEINVPLNEYLIEYSFKKE